ncbi:alpha-1,3-mannosyl-glycoprotein 2-beta-N-acetylglucosaminyltransferase-like [Stylophora pistillata]|uniref:Alpha-1,3-mannosyl-glycoprotein 2-beta-N-acetylglucosaminyltransferase n=1 Tax=Stylophora pistillata TaxID=50429 RepID=A0A2B4RWY4_STYPI|nr:alpha-1,3-mannosyl-glycoprotein 2-beta-N-acetylglucosaminyltransferase-like [Stylophora pistillata]PFX20732.1 Alpha-1,3-mannosyl-glycoprotein 2-beta-N-acetylglucosaminyltransferase [Stylophora pistillata]
MKVVFITKQGWWIILAVCVFVLGNCVLLYRFINKTSIAELENAARLKEISNSYLAKFKNSDSKLKDVAEAVQKLQSKPTKSDNLELEIRENSNDNINGGFHVETPAVQVQLKAEPQRTATSWKPKVVLAATKTAEEFVAAVLVMACNRPTVKRCLDLLLNYRPSAKEFPIVVSQDCGDEATANVIRSYGNKVSFIQQPDLSEVRDVPANMRGMMGYYKISRHYKWALGQVFDKMGHDTVLIVEDDLDIAPDFYEYFKATKPLLDKDPSLWCISAWNDNGKEGMVKRNDILYRTDFFPGLGWMMRKSLWIELQPKWPLGFWDDWMREASQRKDRSCIRPEIPRTRTFGPVGVSRGQFFDQHLKFIKLNDQRHPFSKTDLSYLLKDNYDQRFVVRVHSLPLVTANQLVEKKVFAKDVQVHYSSQKNFEQVAKQLGAMTDYKAGIPRMAYKGIVSIVFSGINVHIVPSD